MIDDYRRDQDAALAELLDPGPGQTALELAEEISGRRRISVDIAIDLRSLKAAFQTLADICKAATAPLIGLFRSWNDRQPETVARRRANRHRIARSRRRERGR